MALEPGDGDKLEAFYQRAIVALGKRVKEIRNVRKISQNYLAASSGIYRSAISEIENGKHNVEFYTVVKLGYGLKIPLEDLFMESMKNYKPFKVDKNISISSSQEEKMKLKKWFQKNINALGIRLAELRKARGYSQDHLDVFSTKYRSDISQIENGEQNVTFFTIVKLAFGLQVPIEDLFIKTMKTYEPFKKPNPKKQQKKR